MDAARLDLFLAMFAAISDLSGCSGGFRFSGNEVQRVVILFGEKGRKCRYCR